MGEEGNIERRIGVQQNSEYINNDEMLNEVAYETSRGRIDYGTKRLGCELTRDVSSWGRTSRV